MATDIKAYRAAMIARKAAAAGMTVEAFIARSEAEAADTMAYLRLRSDRELQQAVLARAAARKSNTLAWGLS